MSLETSSVHAGRGLLTEGDVCARLGISRVSLWRWIRAGRFPAPIYPGPATKRWTEAMYDDYIARLMSERDTALVE